MAIDMTMTVKYSVILIFTFIYVVLSFDCKSSGPCDCNLDGKIFSLKGVKSPLSASSSDGYTFYLDPCGKDNSKVREHCTNPNEIGCQVDMDEKEIAGIAGATGFSAHGDPSKGNLTFQYKFTTTSDMKIRITNLNVKCSSNGETFKFDQEKPSMTYNFTLETNAVCPNQPEPSESSGGMSTGSTLLLLLFIAVLIYFVGGFLFNKFVRNATGAEVIPNIEFWKDFPLLVKDGVRFTCGGWKTTAETYEKI